MDLERHVDNFDLLDAEMKQHVWEILGEMRARCPVAHTEAHGGYWVVTKYDDALNVLRTPMVYSSGRYAQIPPPPAGAAAPDMPPIHHDPPIQREYRRLLNPYFTPDAIAGFEPGMRQLVTEAIDDFVADGKCEFVSQFARRFPSRIFFRFFCGIDSEEILQKNVDWLHGILFDMTGENFTRLENEWMEWIESFVSDRRAGERRNDFIDGLLHGQVEGRALTDGEIIATMMVLIMGGFGTTADTTANAVRRMAERPELQTRLRSEPDQIPKAIDEFLRFDPPVIEVPRMCKQATELDGVMIKAGERVLVSIGSANRDEDEFDHADEIDLDRTRAKHLAFGAGPHRCIGSHVGRLGVKIALEEVLGRMDDIKLVEGDSPRIGASMQAYGPEYMPITFTTIRK